MGNSVLVLGGGLIGLQAARELSRAGARAVVLEQGPILGGKRAALLYGTEEPWAGLKSVAAEPSVDYFTLSHLESIEGEAGAFHVSFSQQPRLVTDDCTRCAHCVPVCPEVAANEYDAGLTFRKAISSPLPETIPDIYAIDLDTCLNTPPNYLPCQRCVEVCDDNAIHFDMPVPPPTTLEVSALVVAVGYADNDALEREWLTAFDYGEHADIVSSVELQRLLEDPGPSGGFAVRPSDEGYPESLLLVLTDVSTGAAWVMGNQLRRLAAQDIEQLQVLVLAADTDDAALAPVLEAATECGATVVCGSWINASADEQNRVCVRYATLPGGNTVELTSELVVLSSEIHPPQETAALAATLGLEVGAAGYLVPGRDGIYLAGGALGTVGIEAGSAQAQEAVKNALTHVDAGEPVAADEVAPDAQAPLATMQREQLEQLLYALMKLGEGGRP